MKKIITILTLLCSFGLKAGAQQFLSREAYRDKVMSVWLLSFS